MRGEWCYFKEFFTKTQCELILNRGLNLPPQDAKLGADGASVIPDHRKSKIRFIQQDNAAFTWLFDAMWKQILIANNDWFRFHLSKLSYIQLAEYDSAYQGEYKKHHDVFWMNNDPIYHRKLTVIVQLTDPDTYTGGDFEFCDITEYPNASEIRTRGTVLVFPSFLEHKATPVTSGIRHSLASWVDGPKWV